MPRRAALPPNGPHLRDEGQQTTFSQGEKRQHDDAEFIKNPESWPCWPVLPVRRYRDSGSFSDCGVLISCVGVDANTVFVANMFNVTDLNSIVTNPDVEKHEYASPEALVADGWVVD